MSDIAQEPVLTFANNTKPSRQVRELLSENTSAPPNMTTSMSLGALIRLAKSGMGICAVPRAVIEAELASGELVVLDTSVELPAISFTASFVSKSPVSNLMSDIASEAVSFLETRLIKNIYQNP